MWQIEIHYLGGVITIPQTGPFIGGISLPTGAWMKLRREGKQR